MNLVGTAVAVGLWLAVLAVGYAVLAYVALFYLPPAEELPDPAVADAAFVFTAPFVLAVTWLSAARNG